MGAGGAGDVEGGVEADVAVGDGLRDELVGLPDAGTRRREVAVRAHSVFAEDGSRLCVCLVTGIVDQILEPGVEEEKVGELVGGVLPPVRGYGVCEDVRREVEVRFGGLGEIYGVLLAPAIPEGEDAPLEDGVERAVHGAAEALREPPGGPAAVILADHGGLLRVRAPLLHVGGGHSADEELRGVLDGGAAAYGHGDGGEDGGGDGCGHDGVS